MSHSRLLRAGLTATVLTVSVFALTACFTITPGSRETPKPEITGFDTIGGGDPQPLDTSEPVEPTAAPEDGYTSLTDDYGVLSLQVPSSWTDISTQPFTTEDDEQWASLAASTDLDAYFQTFNVSGVEFAATSLGGPVEDSALSSFLTGVGSYFDSGCTAEDTLQPYTDGLYTGFYSSWTDCGGVGTYGFAIVAVNPDSTHVVYVRGQIVADDDRDGIVGVITSTFQASI